MVFLKALWVPADWNRAMLRALLAASLITLFGTISCGSGSTPPDKTVPAPDVHGYWYTYIVPSWSPSYGYIDFVGGDLTQSGNNLSGSWFYPVPSPGLPCVGTYPVSGTVSGNQFSITMDLSSGGDSNTIVMAGALSNHNDQVAGSATMNGTRCFGPSPSSSDLKMQRVLSVTGKWLLVAPLEGSFVLDLVQSDTHVPNSPAFAITGTITPVSTTQWCTFTGYISGTNDRNVMLLNAYTGTFVEGSQQFAISGDTTFFDSTGTINGDVDWRSSPCMSGTLEFQPVVMTRQ